MKHRFTVVIVATTALLTGACASGDDNGQEQHPTASAAPATTASAAPATTASAAPAVDSDVVAWCDRWYSEVVENDNPNSAAGSAFLLAEEGVELDEQLISSRSEVIDYRTGPSPTAEEVEQAISDIGLACAAYIATND